MSGGTLTYRITTTMDLWVDLRDYSLRSFILSTISNIKLMILKIVRMSLNILFKNVTFPIPPLIHWHTSLNQRYNLKLFNWKLVHHRRNNTTPLLQQAYIDIITNLLLILNTTATYFPKKH